MKHPPELPSSHLLAGATRKNGSFSTILVCIIIILASIYYLNDVFLEKDLLTVTTEKRITHGNTEMTAKVSTSLGSSGVKFTGVKVREYDGSKILLSGQKELLSKIIFPKNAPIDDEEFAQDCNQWAVVTTIFKPPPSFNKIIDLSSLWCLVIVGDEISPDDEYEKLAKENDHVFYLSAEYQKKNLLKTNEFVSKMPFRSFARKNIGYLFAVYYGAKVIFDFDDDNILTPLVEGTDIAPPFRWDQQVDLENNEWQEASMLIKYVDNKDQETARLSFNPFKYMHPSIELSWPRGFPLDDLQDEFKSEPQQVSVGDLPYAAIGVIQSLCNGNPDTDAIFRLTTPKSTEFTFEREATSLPFLIPYNSYTPYNAQATTHLFASFWGLYLPISVPGRVTDIWRSYIVQRLMKDVGLHVIYTPPIVQHERSSHDYLADHAAEADLYHKTSKLLNHLNSWSSSKEHLSDRIMDLWIELFEHDYIGLEDIEAVRQWLNVLISIGYKFPTPISRTNVQAQRRQPTLEGQPYRAFPYYNVNKDGKTYSQMANITVEEWGKEVSVMNRPESAIVKIIMMTMNQWPMIETWVTVSICLSA